MYCKKSLLLLFLYLISFASSDQSYNTTNKFLECSSTDILCGSTNFTISYPFRLKGMPDYCGHPKFKVQCIQNHTLEIDIAGKLYRVGAIKYELQFLGVANLDYLMSEGCPRTYSNTSLDLSVYKYFKNAINVTLFLSCPRPSPSLNLTHIACLSNKGDSQESYYSLPVGDDHLLVSAYAKNCKSIALIPIYDNMVGFLENSFLEVLHDGFGLKWIVGNGWCGDCVLSGGVCGNDPKMPREQACFCSDGSTSSWACQGMLNI